VVAVKRLVHNGWIRLLIVDPEAAVIAQYEDGEWTTRDFAEADAAEALITQEALSA